MKWLRFELECVELILNTAEYTKADVKYWMEERKAILKEILEYQLKFW